MRRKIEQRNTRKIYKKDTSYVVTLPIEMVRSLKWREGQRVVFKKQGQSLLIEDWKR